MDKNTWIGLALIGVILIGFSWWNSPSEEQLARQRQEKMERDSIARVEAELKEAQQIAMAEELAKATDEEGLAEGPVLTEVKADTVVLENAKVRLTLLSKGGRVVTAELKEYTAYGEDKPLSLFCDSLKESRLNLTFARKVGLPLTTENWAFDTLDCDSHHATMRMWVNREDSSYIDLKYTLPEDEYMMDLDIVAHNMENILKSNNVGIEWQQLIPQHEHGRSFENRYAQLQYNPFDDEVDKLVESEYSRIHEDSRLRWIAFKDQFFSTVMISEEGFTNSMLKSDPKKSGRYIKEYETATNTQLDITGAEPTKLHIYYGPNHYNTLKSYNDRFEGLDLESLVPLGWSLISWVNYLIVIPIFDLLNGWGLPIGLVILLLTIVIKLIVLPFVYKSYRSTAKMRVLRPQMDEINAKYPKPEQMQEKQMAMMNLYRRAGVNPMSGCLPMLLQMPILMAVFWFFPTAIEMRGKGFLWADDLSTYDAVINWGFNLPLIGDHLSLFCVLFTVVNCVYTYINMQQQAGGNDPNMKVMKWMMYAMPLMFFFWFNDYPAGLSYYYLLSLFITIMQMMFFRWRTDDKKLLEQMERAAAKKASKPKSRFMQRLEEMQREQQRLAREQAKKAARR